ncbi:MAG TPA: DUF3775 domain-containing protein [Alphaproteobacteria bacterium]|jgi:hypothetical protein|nr:DUF3775 domain-containing protein [Alphaproteobacteria bacterium]
MAVKPLPRPELNTDTICFVIVKAREFDVQVDVEEPDYGSDAADDKFVQILEAYADNPTFAELRSFIEAMNDDEQAELVALAWIGRGDFEGTEWNDALRLAKERHSGSTALYLCGIPMLGDYLEEGLAAFGLSCADTEREHL